MKNTNLQRRYALRKFKGIGLASAVIGMFFVNHSVSASVISNGTDSITFVNDVSKVSSTSATTFTDDKDASKSVTVDAVLGKETSGKNITEPTKANYNSGIQDGEDILHFTTNATVNYKLESDKSLLKSETISERGTVTTPYDKKGLAFDTDGKDYRKSIVEGSVSEVTGKKNIIKVNGKVYEYVRSEIENADKKSYDKTSFNDIKAPVSPEGMHNSLGEIDYKKTTGKVYLVEETVDGQYGKFVVAEDGVSSDEDAVTKWKAGEAVAKAFTKENVNLQAGDTILVMDRDTYAIGEGKQVSKIIYGEKGYEEHKIEEKVLNNGLDMVIENRACCEFNKEEEREIAPPVKGYEDLFKIGTRHTVRKTGEDGLFGTSDDELIEDAEYSGRWGYGNRIFTTRYVKAGLDKRFGTVDDEIIKDFGIGEPDRSYSLMRVPSTTVMNFVEDKLYSGEVVEQPESMIDVLKKHAKANYTALDYLLAIATSEEDKTKVRNAKKRLDKHLEDFAEKIVKENLDIGILGVGSKKGGLVAHATTFYYDYDESNISNSVKKVWGDYYTLLDAMKNLPGIIGELSVTNKTTKMKEDNTFDEITKVYTFKPNGDGKKVDWHTYRGGHASVSVTSKIERNFKIYNSPDKIALNESNIDIEEVETNSLLSKGKMTINEDGTIKVKDDVVIGDTHPDIPYKKIGENAYIFDLDREKVVDEPPIARQNTPEELFNLINHNDPIRDYYGFEKLRNRVETTDETTYTKKEIMTPIRAYKVMSDEKNVMSAANPIVTHYYRIKITNTVESADIKTGSVMVKYVINNGTQLASFNVMKNLELVKNIRISEYSGDKVVREYTKNGVEKTIHYDVNGYKFSSLKDPKTGFTYEYVGLRQGSPAASGKVVEGTTEVVYEYRLVSEEETTPSKTEVTKTGSIDVKHVVINEDGSLKNLKTEVLKDKVPVEYEDTYVTYSKGVKVSERKEKRIVAENYDTTDKQYLTMKDEATGLVYKYVGPTSDSAPVAGDVTEGEKHVIYSYVLDEKEDNKPIVTESKDKKGTVIVKFVDINGNSIADDEVVKNNVIVAKATTTVSDGKETTTYEETGEEYAVTAPSTIEVDGLSFKLKKIVPFSEKWNNSTVERGLVKEGITTIVYQYVLQLKAPEVEAKEYIGGAVALDPPIVDIPEYEGGAVAIDPPVVEVSEYTGGAVAIDPPVVDIPEYKELHENSVPDSILNDKQNSETKKTEKETPKSKDSTPTSPSEEAEVPDLRPIHKREELPQTGTGQEFAIFSSAASSILAGLGIVRPRKKQ